VLRDPRFSSEPRSNRTRSGTMEIDVLPAGAVRKDLCVIANVLANLSVGHDLMGAIVLSACNMAEVAIPAHVLGGRLRNRNAVINWAFAQKFLIYAVVLGPAFAGSLAGVALSSLKSENSGEIFRMWFMADALGIALVTPLAVALRRSGIGAMRDKEGLAYMILCLGLVGVVTAAVFSQSSYPLLFVIMPFLVFAAFRLGLAGLSAAYVICGHGVGRPPARMHRRPVRRKPNRTRPSTADRLRSTNPPADVGRADCP